ncbi:MAG: DeoR/GlpR family DNA-binding transcription regulator [Catalinimonas sp.]
MTQEQRFALISEYLSQHPDLSVEDAQDLCDASPATVRRDFTVLVDQGKVRRTWGGVTVRTNEVTPTGNMLPANYREVTRREEKKRIAAAAAGRVQDGEIVMIGSGTTTMELAALLANRPVRIVTNSLLLAFQVDQQRTQKRGADVFLIGGMLLPDAGVMIGPRTNEELNLYHADRAFFSAGGVTPDAVTSAHPLIAETERTLMQRCGRISLLVDHTKLGRREMLPLCPPDHLDAVITDDHPDGQSVRKALQEQKIEVITS